MARRLTRGGIDRKRAAKEKRERAEFMDRAEKATKSKIGPMATPGQVISLMEAYLVRLERVQQEMQAYAERYPKESEHALFSVSWDIRKAIEEIARQKLAQIRPDR